MLSATIVALGTAVAVSRNAGTSLYRYFIMYRTHHAHTQHNIIYNSLQNTGRNPLDLGKTSQQFPGPSFWKGLPRVRPAYISNTCIYLDE